MKLHRGYNFLILTICLPILALTGDLTPDKIEIDDIDLNPPENRVVSRDLNLLKPLSFADEAVGVLDKGQLQNLTMNYGQITDTRYEDVGNAPTQYFFDFRYPRRDFTGLCDDFSIFFALPENTKNGNNGNVIDGWTDNDNEDWIAKDGSYGKTHYNPATDPAPHSPVLYPPDNPTTPYLAHSDLIATWPVDEDGNPFWPGYFFQDPETGEEQPGEFASDRDVYAVFDDSHNQLGNPIGIEVEMMAYCYGRPYADKFQFYEFFIHNKSGRRLEDCYVGYYEDPDCSDHGEEILILPDPAFSDPEIPDIILNRDIDGDHGGATRPNAKGITEDFSFGMAILETPHDMGVTTFHYYQDAGPTDDAILWPIISSNPDDPDISLFADQYFHGSNRLIDDVNLLYSQAKQDLVFIVASGPFSMEADETVKSTIVVAVGEDDADFYRQIDQAVEMYKFNFVGPSAPPAPGISAVAGDGQVSLYWENIPEMVPDPFTGEIDFEGYRIYRSQDNGQTWGKEIKDAQENLIGYIPIAQFDIDNGIRGADSRNPFTYLGDDSGIKHTFIDQNVKNGIKYSYTIVAYDRGDSLIYSLESSRGTSSADRNFISITPVPDYLGKIPADVDEFAHIQGTGKGDITISVFDDSQLKEDLYEIHFNGTPAGSIDLYNVTVAETIATNLPLNFLDNPVIDGFQLYIESEQQIGGVKQITDRYGIPIIAGSPDSSKSWTVRIIEFAQSNLEARSQDYEIRFTNNGSIAYSWGSAANSKAAFSVPFEVWNVSGDNEHQIVFQVNDINENQQWEYDENIFIANSVYSTPQIGDTLTADFPADFGYVAVITNYTLDSLNLLPQTGDRIIIESYRSYDQNDVFSFNFKPDAFDPAMVDLSEIRAVPNPYIVGAEWEELQNVHQIRFMFLPPVCTINIYTINGEMIRSINHDSDTGDEIWNLTNESNQAVAFGVYVFVITTPEGTKHIDKLAIIR